MSQTPTDLSRETTLFSEISPITDELADHVLSELYLKLCSHFGSNFSHSERVLAILLPTILYKFSSKFPGSELSLEQLYSYCKEFLDTVIPQLSH